MKPGLGNLAPAAAVAAATVSVVAAATAVVEDGPAAVVEVAADLPGANRAGSSGSSLRFALNGQRAPGDPLQYCRRRARRILQALPRHDHGLFKRKPSSQ